MNYYVNIDWFKLTQIWETLAYIVLTLVTWSVAVLLIGLFVVFLFSFFFSFWNAFKISFKTSYDKKRDRYNGDI
jgi:hypothetical protein